MDTAPEISIDPDGLEDEQPAIVDDFANCSVRDILYCQMPVSAQDRLRIKPGHDVRPYLVMKKGENGFWGYPMTTSHQRYAYDEKLMYNLRETGQSEIKSSCFLFVPSVYVPAENVFYPWGRLDPRWEGAIRTANRLSKKSPHVLLVSFVWLAGADQGKRRRLFERRPDRFCRVASQQQGESPPAAGT